MRDVLKLLRAASVAALFALPANAQTIGGGTGGTGGTTGGGTGGGAGGGTTSQVADLVQIAETPPITGVSAYTSTTNTNQAINASNFLRSTYGNVYYQGRAGAQPDETPGGFGQVLYNTAGGGTGGNIGFAGGGSTGLGGVTGSTGRTGGIGGTTGGLGGVGGTAGRTGGLGGVGGSTLGGTSGLSSSSVGGQIVPLARNISYQGVLKFQAPVATPTQVQADLRGMLDRSNMIANPRNVLIQLDGPGVILRGSAVDEDEARMIEGMVRLTPGVQFVTNELQYPRP